jgi:hypothetical protein
MNGKALLSAAALVAVSIVSTSPTEAAAPAVSLKQATSSEAVNLNELLW